MAQDEASPSQSLKSKEEGNAYFKDGDYEKALACYNQALKQNRNSLDKDADQEKENEKAVILKNRAACYLKLEKYESTIRDATQALEILPQDTKALFRRCQALEKLGKIEESFKDARAVKQIDPKNNAVVPILQRLGALLQTKSDRFRTTDGLVNEMLSALSSDSSPEDKKAKAMKNLVILAKDEPGAQRIFREGAVPQLVSLLNAASTDQIISILKVLKGLCTNSQSRSLVVLQLLTKDKLLHLVRSSSDEVSVAAITVASQTLEALIPLREKKTNDDKDAPDKLDNEDIVRVIFAALLEASKDKEVCAEGRDAAIDAFVRVFPRNSLAVDLFVDIKGVRRLLEVAASTAPCEAAEKRPLAVTDRTRMHLSLALAGMFDMFGFDQKKKERFIQEADAAVTHYMNQGSDAAHIEGSTVLCCLFQGVKEAATPLLNKEEVLGKVVGLATKPDRVSQIVAAETLAIAASDKSTCTAITSQAMTVLTALYDSKDPRVQVRALVGFCKVNSVGGGAVNERNFPEGTSEKLYKSVRSFLVGPQLDKDSGKWAAEALSFLTMDADVKETFVADKEALDSLINLTKAKDSSLLYGVCQTFVNLTNTYDKPEIPDEMKQLGEFAKVKMPQFSEKDSEEHVNKRIDKLVQTGIIGALASLASTDSNASREMIARVFMGIATKQDHRGLMVQQGGVKALLPLAHSNTAVGKDTSAHALAKVAISMNPDVAFPGQRSLSLVRPLISLLQTSKTGLQQFESLMALTNLAQMNDEVRKHIVKERGVVEIESLMFDEHELIKRAATECMCNMIMCQEVFELFENENSPTERVKLLTVYAGEDDFHLARAASGGLAMLTSSEKVCNQVAKVGCWLDVMKELLVRGEKELVHRGTHIVANLMAANKEIATKLVESEILEVLMVLSKESDPDKAATRECAERALQTAVDQELIKPNLEN